MLQSLHVKNLALIEETEIEFGEGLNILTGETGAGKSILIDSINLALGAKFDKDFIRKDAEYAFVELVFSCNDTKIKEKFSEMDLPWEDGLIIISRRMQATKSVGKVNGETVTIRQMKEIAEFLIDIHGQHEHQSLLHKKKHLEILDDYIGQEILEVLEEVGILNKNVKLLKQELEEESLDEEAKKREQALVEFELTEIENASLKPGEDTALEVQYKKLVNGKKIMENISESYINTGNENPEGAGNQLSRALRLLRNVATYDVQLGQFEEQLSQIDNLLADYNRDIAEYMSDMEFDSGDFQQIEERLNQINHLKEKYGDSIEKIIKQGKARQDKLDKLLDYDNYIQKKTSILKETEERLQIACQQASVIRKKHAQLLQKDLIQSLENLNFLTVKFQIEIREQQSITSKGFDDVEFIISTNPGEEMKPLSQVASGGELSRIMLAIKTVFSSRDAIETLIFDEIDTGISGKTAWKVSEQLNLVGKEHQVICITHLPQIAAMADMHFVIEKQMSNESTITNIKELNEEESLKELARLLGSDNLTQAALDNAKDIRRLALEQKNVKLK